MADKEPTYFSSAEEFYHWLGKNHESATELLVGFHKTKTSKPSMTWAEAVDQVLCFGWIDGVRRSLGDDAYTIRFTPRKPKSGWSKINTENAERLIAEGRMRPAGLAEVEKAKADGRWHSAYDSPKTRSDLPDLDAALDANPKAKAFYETLNRQNTYAIQYRLQTAKKPETRAKRLALIIDMLDRGQKFH